MPLSVTAPVKFSQTFHFECVVSKQWQQIFQLACINMTNFRHKREFQRHSNLITVSRVLELILCGLSL